MPSSATHPIPDAPIVAGEEQLAVSEGPISFGGRCKSERGYVDHPKAVLPWLKH